MMIWDPKKRVKFTNSLKKCDLNFDPDQEKLHECSKYVYRITGCTDRGSSFHVRKYIKNNWKAQQ